MQGQQTATMPNPNYPGSNNSNQQAKDNKPKQRGGKSRKPVYFVVVVVIIIIAAAFVFLNGNSGASLVPYDNVQVSQQQLSQMQSIATNTTLANRVGAGIVSPYPTKEKISNVTMVNGKPAVIYVGADYCPYCGITRWGFVLALMRFGTFTSLHYMTSSSTDAYANTATFTFYNSSYESSIIAFIESEIETNTEPYQTLQVPDQLQNSTVSAFDPGGSIPFIDFGNRSVQIGASISPNYIKGMSWQEVISKLNDSNSTVSQAIIGQADVFTAEICAIDGDMPSNVCNQTYVSKILG